MNHHQHGTGEPIGTVVAVDPGEGRARVLLEHPLDAGEQVAVPANVDAGDFQAQVSIDGHPVTRGDAGQEVTLSDVPAQLRIGDVLVRRTTTLGSWLRDALAHARGTR